MKELFSLDLKDYRPDGKVFARPSARAVIARDGKVLLVHSRKYDYYKFPGGGIEKGESAERALCREVTEETGYSVLPDSIEEFGYVLRRAKDEYDENGIFEQYNYYYFCEIGDDRSETKLDAYESDEGFEAVWMEPFAASHYNRYQANDIKAQGADRLMIKRESKVLDLVDLELRKRDRKRTAEKTINELGHPEYFDMIEFVRKKLEETSTEKPTSSKTDIFYSRADHTLRVLAWAIRLYRMEEKKEEIRFDNLVIATIFHDVGRGIADFSAVPHAQAGVPITREYLLGKGYPEDKIEDICTLVALHSDKYRMKEPEIDRTLLMLMEADLLDEMGAHGIVMDCMITESRNPEARFEDCLDHMTRYTLRLQEEDNPMVSPAGRRIWDEKTELVRGFVSAFKRDLELTAQ